MPKRKRTKKEALERLPSLPSGPLGKLPSPLRVPLSVLKGAELGAKALIELDPLNRLASPTPKMTQKPGEMNMQTQTSPVAKLAEVVNDPSITVDEAMMQVINDPAVAMADNGEILVRANGGVNSDFARAFSMRAAGAKKTKKRKNLKLAAAFREANARMRTKSGKLRKGKTQADVARLAHRLLKRM